MNITHRNNIGSFLNELGLTGTGVEVGVYKGIYSEIILKQWQGEKLLLVDNWNIPGKPNRAIEKACRKKLTTKFPGRIVFIKALSTVAASTIEDQSLDFAYIDADHTYASAKSDIEAWYPKVKKGGIFCGHDYAERTSGVVQAVDEFLTEHPEYQLHLTDDWRKFRSWTKKRNLKSWWVQV